MSISSNLFCCVVALRLTVRQETLGEGICTQSDCTNGYLWCVGYSSFINCILCLLLIRLDPGELIFQIQTLLENERTGKPLLTRTPVLVLFCSAKFHRSVFPVSRQTDRQTDRGCPEVVRPAKPFGLESLVQQMKKKFRLFRNST